MQSQCSLELPSTHYDLSCIKTMAVATSLEQTSYMRVTTGYINPRANGAELIQHTIQLSRIMRLTFIKLVPSVVVLRPLVLLLNSPQ